MKKNYKDREIVDLSALIDLYPPQPRKKRFRWAWPFLFGFALAATVAVSMVVLTGVLSISGGAYLALLKTTAPLIKNVIITLLTCSGFCLGFGLGFCFSQGKKIVNEFKANQLREKARQEFHPLRTPLRLSSVNNHFVTEYRPCDQMVKITLGPGHEAEVPRSSYFMPLKTPFSFGSRGQLKATHYQARDGYLRVYNEDSRLEQDFDEYQIEALVSRGTSRHARVSFAPLPMQASGIQSARPSSSVRKPEALQGLF